MIYDEKEEAEVKEKADAEASVEEKYGEGDHTGEEKKTDLTE